MSRDAIRAAEPMTKERRQHLREMSRFASEGSVAACELREAIDEIDRLLALLAPPDPLHTAPVELEQAAALPLPTDGELLDWIQEHGRGNVRGTDFTQWSVEGAEGQGDLRQAVADAMRKGAE